VKVSFIIIDFQKSIDITSIRILFLMCFCLFFRYATGIARVSSLAFSFSTSRSNLITQNEKEKGRQCIP